MSNLATLRFFSTPAHACSYLEEREASTIFVDPQARITHRLYSQLSDMGFRRSGDYIYRPHCQHCNACIAARIDVANFQTRRRHKRIWKANQDLQIETIKPRFSRELYHLYSRYIEVRHGDGDMFPPSQEQFASFLMSSWSDSRFHCFRKDDQLLAVAVTDQLDHGLSAVYTFFDPDAENRSLGTLAILWQIEHARELGLPWVYLGYWIADCQKMSYKSDFQPLQLLQDNQWQAMKENHKENNSNSG